MAIAVFYAFATLAGAGAPALFGAIVDTGEPGELLAGYALASGLMVAAAVVARALGVDAEGRSLKSSASPAFARFVRKLDHFRSTSTLERRIKVDYRDLDRNIARTRIVVSLVGLLSIYVDPTIDEPFSIERDLLIVLMLHLAYAVGIYFQVRRIVVTPRFTFVTAAFDVLFATVISLLTEGPTSPDRSSSPSPS